jgi:4-hydroxybenzoate polyprenyltransferase
MTAVHVRLRPSGVERVAAHIRAMRPYSLVWFVAAPIATMALWLQQDSLSIRRLAMLIATFALTDAGLTTLNDICDRETDRCSVESQRKNRPVAGGWMSIRGAYIQVVLLEIAALVTAAFISWVFAMLLALGIAYGVAYSARPLSLGGRPVWSQAFWAVLWPGMYLGAYIVMSGDFVRGLPYVTSTILFMGAGETLAKDIRDIDNDGATGKVTTPVALGVPLTATVALVAFAFGAAGYLFSVALLVREPAPLLATMSVALGLWCATAADLVARLRKEYDKVNARALHMGAIRVFLTVNLLMVTGLATR